MLLAPAALLALSGLVAAAPLEQIAFTQPTSSLSSIVPSLKLPACHARQLEAHLASLTERRLIQLSPDSEPVWMTEGEKALLIFTEGRRKFVDVTDEEQIVMAQSKSTIPKSLTYSKKSLKPLFDDLDTGAMKTFLTAFSGFRTRYYRSETGKESQRFLLKTIRDIAKSNSKLNITVEEFPHPWGQNSIIARFEPSGRSLSDDIVILGGHQDSTNLLPFLPAPGADDDGSGTTSLLEGFKVLVKHSFVPSTNPVEFHWYSAEEGGLLGSQAVAQSYAKEGKSVRSMAQVDMSGFRDGSKKPTIGLIRDFVSPELADLTALLATEYTDIGYTDTKCGYACSDHASWSKIGAPAIFTIESTFEDSNHDIHSTRDTLDKLSFDHMAQFSRLVIAHAVELGGGASLGLKSSHE